jgi:anti-sigma B factor antagonist
MFESMAIKISSRQVGDVTIVDISGRMLAGAEGQKILMALVDEFDHGHRWLLVNCAELTFLDSSGLGDLMAAHAAIIRRGGVLRLLSPTRTVRELLERTKLDGLLDVCQDEASGVASFNDAENERTRQRLASYMQRTQ